MPTDLPIACSLTATQLSTRLAEMADIGRAALRDIRTTGTHAQLTFAAGESVRERVEAIAAAESQCCAFLHMTVSDEPDLAVLTIDAPEAAEQVVADLVDAFGGTTEAA